jgi:phage protein D
MLTPAYKLTIGDAVVDTTDEPQASTLVDLTVTLDMDVPADSATMVLAQVGGLEAARGDEVAIELGYAEDGGLTQVMVGTVVTVEPGLTRTRAVAHSAAAALLRTFVEQTYESQTASEIVRDLAGQAGVDVDTAEDGISFPAYVVHGRCSAHRHMHDLAELCGFDLYINADGALVFERFISGNAIHVFEYAKQIVELEALRTPARADVVEAWGESPTGSKGEDAWGWLTKDFSGTRGSAGSGPAKLLLERTALRTAEAAASAAEAAHTRIQRQTVRGRLLTVGQPQVKLGDAIRLREVPAEGLNETFQVRSVTHRISKAGGFTTTVGFRAIET